MITHNINALILGKYDLYLESDKHNPISSWSFSNIITDGGMNAIGQRSGGEISAFEYFQVGEGSVPVSSSDVGLATPISVRVNRSDEAVVSVSGSDATGSFWDVTFSRYFLTTEANGNITEIGAFTSSSNGRMSSRALVRDEFGSPVAITKTSDNQLRVRYTVRTYLPTSDITGSINMQGNDYNYTIRPQNIFNQQTWGYNISDGFFQYAGSFLYNFFGANWSTFIGAGRVSPSGSLVNVTGSMAQGGTTSTATEVTPQFYVDDTFYRDVIVRFDPNLANYGTTGIKTLTYTPLMQFGGFQGGQTAQYQVEFSPNIPKTNLLTLSLTFRLGWGRTKIYE